MGKPSPIGLLGIYTNDPSGPRCQTTDFTNRSWAELVLRYLNEFAFPPLIGPPEAPIPVTTNNINNLTIWMNNENNINNSQSWWLRNNPLNNSLASKAYGLGPYADLDVAAYWAAMEIRRFPTIVAALDNDAKSGRIFSGRDTIRLGVQPLRREGRRFRQLHRRQPYSRQSLPTPSS